MTLPWPNFAHGDRGISAKPRGAARFLSDLHMCRVGDGLAGWGGGIRTSASRKSDLLNFIPPEQDLGVDRAPELFARSALEHL